MLPSCIEEGASSWTEYRYVSVFCTHLSGTQVKHANSSVQTPSKLSTRVPGHPQRAEDVSIDLHLWCPADQLFTCPQPKDFATLLPSPCCECNEPNTWHSGHPEHPPPPGHIVPTYGADAQMCSSRRPRSPPDTPPLAGTSSLWAAWTTWSAGQRPRNAPWPAGRVRRLVCLCVTPHATKPSAVSSPACSIWDPPPTPSLPPSPR